MPLSINRKDITCGYPNGKTFNRIAWTTTIIVIVMTLIFVVSKVF